MHRIAKTISYFFLITIFIPGKSFGAEPDLAPTDKRLELKQIITEIPETSLRAIRRAFSKDAILPWAAIVSSTTVLVYDDEEWLAESRRFGKKMNWSQNDKTETKLEIGGINIFRAPTDTGSAIYFLGDGWLHFSIAGGFLASGYFGDNTRPFNTGVQMIHGMMTSTIFNQALKRSFGRETPNFQTKKRGALHPFPGFKNYNETTAKYDAMPSGHMMTVTSQFTIFHLNYPEYAPYTFAAYGVWSFALMTQMVNNGVHWWSDYPLGIGMGYLFGSQAYQMGKDEKVDDNKTKHAKVYFLPYVSRDGVLMNLTWAI